MSALPHRPAKEALVARLGAEFVVIVLGVLVALGVDAWMERRADAESEAGYYQALAGDLASDTLEYARAIANIERSMEAAEHVAAVIRGDGADYPASRPLVQSVVIASWVNYPDWASGTMDELINSGTIRLLRNARLKTALLARYTEAREFRARAQGPEHATYLEYMRLIRGLAPLDAYKALYRTTLNDRVESDFGVTDAELARRIRGRDDLLVVTESMLVEWWSLWNFFNYEWDASRALLALLRSEGVVTEPQSLSA